MLRRILVYGSPISRSMLINNSIPSSDPSNIYRITVLKDEGEINGPNLRWTRDIAGIYPKHKEGYRIISLPSSAAEKIKCMKRDNVNFPQRSDLFKIFAAIVQMLYALWQLVKYSSDHPHQLQYSAVILTTIPYLIMSFINLSGNILTPTYPSLYLVKTFVMDEAQNRGDTIQGWVGEIDLLTRGDSQSETLELLLVKRSIIPITRGHCGTQAARAGVDPEPSSRLSVCFKWGCQHAHVRNTFQTPSGKPGKESKYSFQKYLVVGAIWIIALVVPIGTSIFLLRLALVKEKIILPIWLAIGYIISIWLTIQPQQFDDLILV